MFLYANIRTNRLKRYFCTVKTSNSILRFRPSAKPVSGRYSCLTRALYLLLGWSALVSGVVGIFVPLLPTTPFLLLAAWAFYRSSPQLYDRLLAHPYLGTYIRNFREYRAIPLRAKVVSVTLIWATLLYCIFGVVDPWWWAQLGLLLLAVGLTWHILSYATLRQS